MTANGEISSEVPSFPGPPVARGEDASKLIRYLDEAGIRLGVVLSEAYFFDSPKNDVADRLDKVRAENDWTADQVAGFKDRLVAFCSFNPLADYALAELERCAASGRFVGIKLHFGMSGVNLRDAGHIVKVRTVVEAANRHRMALIVHVRAGPEYGGEEARMLLDRIVSAAPDVAFQIAHLWGGEQFSAHALRVYADAISRGADYAQAVLRSRRSCARPPWKRARHADGYLTHTPNRHWQDPLCDRRSGGRIAITRRWMERNPAAPVEEG